MHRATKLPHVLNAFAAIAALAVCGGSRTSATSSASNAPRVVLKTARL